MEVGAAGTADGGTGARREGRNEHNGRGGGGTVGRDRTAGRRDGGTAGVPFPPSRRSFYYCVL